MHGRILIVDDVATNRIIYKVKLADAFYEPLLASDGASCLEVARGEKPDLILLDLGLPDMPGTEVLRRLRADPVTRGTPVIVLTATRDPEARFQALSMGADDVLSKPVTDQVLMARVRNLLRARGETGFAGSPWGLSVDALGFQDAPPTFERPGVVAMITSNAEAALKWKLAMQGFLREALVPMTREQAMALATPAAAEAQAVPDVFLIDLGPGRLTSGLQLMSELNSRHATRFSATCIVTPEDVDTQAAMAFDMGADDVVAREVHPRELAMRLRILLRRKRQADVVRASVENGLRMAVIDPLTGVYNRRYAMPRLAGIAAQAAQEGADFAVMVVDLDRFKSVNDRFGHAAGDAVLCEMARRLSENLRMADLLARIGGEEFLVALPNISLEDAERVSDRLRRVISETPVRLPSGEVLEITASIGVALGTGCGHQSEDVAALIELADQALLRSKHLGRNRVTFSQTAA